MSQRQTDRGPSLPTLFTPRRAAIAGMLCAAAILGQPGSARAAEPGPDTLPIHIIAVQTGDADDQAEGLTKALRSAVRAMPGWSLGEGDNSLEVLVLKLQCAEPPDVACQSRIADVIKSDRYVWGVINKKGDNVAGELNYWVRGQGTSKAPIEYPANLTEPNDEALKKVATDAITTLTGGPPKGQLHVKAGNVSGQVFVDGQPVGALTNGEGTFAVPSGPRKITVKAAGYSDAETTTVVKATGTVDVALNPQIIGETKPTDYRKIGGYVGIGAGVVLAGLGVVSGVQILNAQSALDGPRKADGAPPDLCASPADDVVRDACSKSVFGPLQFVFYGLGAVAGGTGLYLLLTSGTTAAPAPATGWTFTPYAGPQGGGLGARYRF